VRSLGSPAGNLTRVVEVPIRYADLSVGGAANATRATGPDGTDLTTKHPLVTPGFELAGAAAAVALAALAARRRRRSL